MVNAYYIINVQIKQVILFLLMLCVSGQVGFSQDRKTKNNYTGDWKTPASWDPTWVVPQTIVNNLDVTINGYITAHSSLTFSGASSKLIVDDTLVIIGNLTIADNNDVQVNNNGILIVRGNLTISDDSKIETKNYIIVTGDIVKLGSTNNGEFSSDDNPVKVFIGGTISPSSLSITKANFPVFNCSSPPTSPYPHSGCSYGNMDDIVNDPIYPFFQSTCTTPTSTATSNSPVCSGSPLTLTGGPAGMTTYSWTGPNGFTANTQSPTVSTAATAAMAGVYTLTVTDASGCPGVVVTPLIVNDNPIANAGPDQELEYIYETQMKAELSFSETGEWSLISGTGRIGDIHSPSSRVTELRDGDNFFQWKVTNNGCEASDEVKITVHDLFIPSVITPDGDGKNDFFKIGQHIGKVYLIIFNRWGVEEYRNDNYSNDWDGRNNKGAELPVDTYFYVLKFENSKIIKGSVLIER